MKKNIILYFVFLFSSCFNIDSDVMKNSIVNNVEWNNYIKTEAKKSYDIASDIEMFLLQEVKQKNNIQNNIDSIVKNNIEILSIEFNKHRSKSNVFKGGFRHFTVDKTFKFDTLLSSITYSGTQVYLISDKARKAGTEFGLIEDIDYKIELDTLFFTYNSINDTSKVGAIQIFRKPKN